MDIPRHEILPRLRTSIAKSLETIENATGLSVRFAPLPDSSHVSAGYMFDTRNNLPTVSLGASWEDVDVAHELMHIQLELLDGYSVLAWRRDVRKSEPVLAAIEKIRTLPDDEVVHSRLIAAGLRLDGEVLKSQFFDDRCTTVPRLLRTGRSVQNDGMAHLDSLGYGDLYRATLFVQVQLVRDKYSDQLEPERRDKLDDFITAFAHSLPEQHRLGVRMLELFQDHDVCTVGGHATILAKLSEITKLSTFMGVSSYVRRCGRYVLPWPKDETPKSSARRRDKTGDG